MGIPLFDLGPQNDRVREEVRAAALRVLDSGRYILGEEVEAFETACAEALGACAAVGVSSGTCALMASLAALGVGPGDEVAVPAFTYGATATAVRWVGAKPVFTDIDPVTFNMAPASLQEALTPRTRAAVPVHLYGLPADLEALLALCNGANVAVVEDAAQSLGARWRGRQTGTLGAAGCYSFYPTKPLGGFGDGGLVAASSRDLETILRVIRGQGDAGGYRFVRLGANFRLDALQAAALGAKLPFVEEWRLERARAADWYAEGFGAADLKGAVTLPTGAPEGCTHAWALYVIRAERRDALAARLREKGIGCGVYYPAPLHVQPAFADLGYEEGRFPEAERASREVLALPMFSGITQDQVARVVEVIRAFYRG